MSVLGQRKWYYEFFKRLGLFLGATFDADTKTIAFTGVDATLVAHETPTGTVDGDNTEFTLAHAPDGTKHWGTINGLEQVPTLHYTVTGTGISFVEPPPVGAVIDFMYFY